MKKKLLNILLLGSLLNVCNLVHAGQEIKLEKKAKFNEVPPSEFEAHYYYLSISGEFLEIKAFAEEQNKILEDMVKKYISINQEFEKKQKELEGLLRGGAESQEGTEKKVQEIIPQLEELNKNKQTAEMEIQKKQAALNEQVQTKIAAILDAATLGLAQKIYDETGTAMVFVPLFIGKVPEQLDASKDIVKYVNDEYNKKKAAMKKAPEAPKKASAAAAK